MHYSLFWQNEQAQAERKSQFDKLNALFGPLKQEFDRKTKEMQKTSELVQALTTGVSAQEGQENGYMEQLQGRITICSNTDNQSIETN
jgi:hypothetical protein